ncbi:hypothetical protein HMPREF3197_02093 [Klebsiella pneumoniae]|nr:hypothetical protein HMPREF9538_00790 [Klebsiella sp. MS 92-3]KXA26795.1 hypothetical protein HMPREF3197_02093 [Klebsiella pneumoniae]
MSRAPGSKGWTIYYSGKDDSGSQIVCGLFNLPNNIFLNRRA